SAVLTCLFLLLALQNKRERFLWLIVAFMVLICFATMLNIVTFGDTLAYKHYIVLCATIEFIGSVPFLMIPLILLNIFKRKPGWDLKAYLFLILVTFSFAFVTFDQFLYFILSCIAWSIYYLISIRATSCSVTVWFPHNFARYSLETL